MKIVVYLLTAAIQLVVAVAGFFILLLGLNGYSERQATPSLILYLVVSVVTILSMGALAILTAKTLLKRNWIGQAGAACVATLGMSITGVVILVGSLFASFLLAEVVRGMK